MAGPKLSNQALVVWAVIGLLFLAAAIATPRGNDQRSIRRACFSKQIHMCGDLLCESSDSDVPEHIMRSMYHILEDCISRPEAIEDQYYDSTMQSRMLDEY